jgi:hypothetical protein
MNEFRNIICCTNKIRGYSYNNLLKIVVRINTANKKTSLWNLEVDLHSNHNKNSRYFSTSSYTLLQLTSYILNVSRDHRRREVALDSFLVTFHNMCTDVLQDQDCIVMDITAQ